jgi:tetrapyrrole methylase family protein/MazG family protein
VTRARVRIVGLGPAGRELLTAETERAIATTRPAFLRTGRHPAAEELCAPGEPLHGAETFDDVYERSTTLDEVYGSIVEALVGEATEHREVLYAVPGSPAVAECTVELLRADDRVEVDVLPALSFADLTWARLGVDPLTDGVRIVDGQRFAAEAAGERGPLLVAQCDSRLVLSGVKLAVEDPPEEPVLVLQRLGLPDERIDEVAWDDLDRVVEPDHLTSLFLPHLAAPIATELVRLAELMRTLRRDCPWDREQTHHSLVRHLVEEAYEVVEALEAVDVEAGTGYDAMEEELGDLLFQVVFHAELAAEEGQFTLADVARRVHDKLYARHPHVFGDVVVDGPGGVEANWDRIKRAEKGRASAMDGIPRALPSLLLALKVHERSERAGMPFPSVESAFAKVAEELEEVRVDPGPDELGDLLFATVGLAHELDVEPEGALRTAADRFATRFRSVEQEAAAVGLDLPAADQSTLDARWDRAKNAEVRRGVPGRLPSDE